MSDSCKEEIIKRFDEHVRNKEIQIKKVHDGCYGHWLEERMGIKPNGKNEPDLYGYEMKKESRKITFGDFSATWYLYTSNSAFSRSDFIKTFGMPNPKKHGRYSWSGKCVPKYGMYNECGQILTIDKDKNICVYYSYSKDMREKKDRFLECVKVDDLLIAFWSHEKMRKHIEVKFNNKGFFICRLNKENRFDKICFGSPFNFDYFIDHIKSGNIIFDSGMYNGNTRNYSHFRSNNKTFWSELITEEH